jgi:tripartite ATP-independent transporter DctP family solute receptor
LENHPGEPITDAIYAWARLINERSGGTMRAEVFPSSILGNKNELIDQMLAGMAVITLADGGFFADRGAPDMGITMGPYFFGSWDDAWRIIESDWWEEQSQVLAGQGLQIIAPNFVYGERHTLTTRPIRTLADFQGLRLRVPNNLMQIRGTELLGASPTPLPLGDVYTALQQGIIDGVENPLFVLYGGRFHEVARYLTLTAHIRLITTWFTGTLFWDTLTPEQQNILLDTGREAGMYNNELVARSEADFLRRFREAGVEIIEIDQSTLQEATRGFYYLPDMVARWTPGLYERLLQIKAGN